MFLKIKGFFIWIYKLIGIETCIVIFLFLLSLPFLIPFTDGMEIKNKELLFLLKNKMDSDFSFIKSSLENSKNEEDTIFLEKFTARYEAIKKILSKRLMQNRFNIAKYNKEIDLLVARYVFLQLKKNKSQLEENTVKQDFKIYNEEFSTVSN